MTQTIRQAVTTTIAHSGQDDLVGAAVVEGVLAHPDLEDGDRQLHDPQGEGYRQTAMEGMRVATKAATPHTIPPLPAPTPGLEGADEDKAWSISGLPRAFRHHYNPVVVIHFNPQ